MVISSLQLPRTKPDGYDKHCRRPERRFAHAESASRHDVWDRRKLWGTRGELPTDEHLPNTEYVQ